jgi:iron only hydrogenase large subunit-like protein
LGRNTKKNGEVFHYVRIEESLCNGCVLCMKACPTKAIRVRQSGSARIEGFCIDCGECVRVCPRGAVKPVITESYDLNESPYSIVSASTVLYAQFGEDVMPNDVLLGLRRMGFDYVHDQSYTSEMFNVAIELYIKERRQTAESAWPLISPVCPVVVRLIAYRFPSLLKHIPPLATPREIVAREAKSRLSAKYQCNPEEIKVLHITPCPAKMICIQEPLFQDHSYLDAAIGISTIYEEIRRNIQELEEDKVLHHSSGVGLGWGMSGGEVAGLDLNCLAVSGLQETIHYLEKIEMGLLSDVDYVEFRICTEGCVGGPLTVRDKYQAKHHVQKLVRMFGVEKRVKYDYVKKLYGEGWFLLEKEATPLGQNTSRGSVSEGIERQAEVERILHALPRKECGVCGCPDCRTFAEDVVDGRATLNHCIFMGKKRRSKNIPKGLKKRGPVLKKRGKAGD